MQTKDHVYKSLGEMVVAFQYLEKTIERLIFSCMTSSFTQISIIVSEMSFRSKLNTMSSLIKSLHHNNENVINIGNIHKTLDDLRQRCQKCESRRNQLIHSFYVPEFKSAPDLMIRMKDSVKSKNGYKHSFESFDSNSLDADVMFINKTTEDLNSFCVYLCNQFERFHGFPGMEHFADYEMLRKAISQTAIGKG